MKNWTRRQLAQALAVGAMASATSAKGRSKSTWREAREIFPQGVASGDPEPNSVILWTRRLPPADGAPHRLTVQVSTDAAFEQVEKEQVVSIFADSDWTCRVEISGLKPRSTYWYRFIDEQGQGSRVGRTCTAPAVSDGRPVTFAYVSCQNANFGPLTPWRRMIHDDLLAQSADQIAFVLHLGDFIYDSVWLPEDRPNGYFDRTLRHIVDFPDGERHDDYHIPVSVADYRALYEAYLKDPDLQDARARWPFVQIWDNGEFSNDGWQGLERFGGKTIPAQRRKVAANRAWFEFIPSRARTVGGSLTRFSAPAVVDAPIADFDRDGLGLEQSNLAAIFSLTGYRSLRWGRHVDLLLTDQRSYRSEDYTAAPEARGLSGKRFFQLVPFETLQQIDAGGEWPGGAPATLEGGEAALPNFRRTAPPRTLLGRTQKRWFLDKLSTSQATWKIWGNTVATLDMRADPQNLPEGLALGWRGKGYAGFARTDHSTAYAERGEIYDHVAAHGITGFVTLSGDRHSFWAGYAAKALPPEKFEPVGVAFVVGSISSPGMVEAFEHILPKDHPLRALYLVDRPGEAKPEPSVNLLLKHGVTTCLNYAADRNLEGAVARRDPNNAPHVEFVDMGGHGFGIVRATSKALDVEFVCVPRPTEPTQAADGGPIRYRVAHSVAAWPKGTVPRLVRHLRQGDVGLSV